MLNGVSRVARIAAVSALLAVPTFSSNAALTDFHYVVQISAIEVVNDGTNNAIYVRGTFTPTLPCSVQGFFIQSTDSFEKEIMSMLVTAKSSGRSITYAHSYCFSGGVSDGYSRGNGIVMI